MSERVLVGLAAAGGVAVAGAFVLRDSPPSGNGAGGECERARALQAPQLSGKRAPGILIKRPQKVRKRTKSWAEGPRTEK